MPRRRLTTRMAAERLSIPQKEVLRHIRLGDIPAEKFDWIWTVDEGDLPKVMEQQWYKRIVRAA